MLIFFKLFKTLDLVMLVPVYEIKILICVKQHFLILRSLLLSFIDFMRRSYLNSSWILSF